MKALSTEVLPTFPRPHWRDTLRWVWKDAVLRNWRSCLPLVVLGFAAPVLQVLLFSMLFKVLGSNQGIIQQSILGIPIQFGVSHGVVIEIGIVIPIMLSMTFLAIYWSERGAQRLAQKHYAFCMMRALRDVASTPVFPLFGISTPQKKIILRRVVTGDSRLTGRLMLRLMAFPIPFFGLIGYVGIMLWMNATLTATFLVVFPLLLWMQYSVVRSSSHLSRVMEDLGPKTGQEIGAVIQSYSVGGAVDDDEKALRRKLIDEGATGEQLKTQMNLFLLTDRTKVINDILGAVVVGAVIVVFALQSAKVTPKWKEVLAYLVVLKLASNYARALAGNCTSINRFLPQVGRYRIFLEAMQEAREKFSAGSTWRDARVVAVGDGLSKLNASEALLAMKERGFLKGTEKPLILAAPRVDQESPPLSVALGVDSGDDRRNFLACLKEGARFLPDEGVGLAALNVASPAVILEAMETPQKLVVLSAAARVRKESLLLVRGDDLSEMGETSAQFAEWLTQEAGLIVVLSPPFSSPHKILPASDMTVFRDGKIERVLTPAEREAEGAKLATVLRNLFKRSGVESAALGTDVEDDQPGEDSIL